MGGAGDPPAAAQLTRRRMRWPRRSSRPSRGSAVGVDRVDDALGLSRGSPSSRSPGHLKQAIRAAPSPPPNLTSRRPHHRPQCSESIRYLVRAGQPDPRQHQSAAATMAMGISTACRSHQPSEVSMTQFRPRAASRALGALLLAGALTAGAAVTAPTAAVAGLPGRSAPSAGVPQPERHGGGVPAPAVPRIRWASCGPGLDAFQCATVKVPQDYDRPYGPTTSLALTRLPAADPARRIGTLFVNPGGPGGSGVDFVQQAAQVLAPPQVRARFDLLGFDPRGVARSDPATCFPTAAEEDAFPCRRAHLPPHPGAGADVLQRIPNAGPRLRGHVAPAPAAPLHGQRRPRPGSPPAGRRRRQAELRRLLLRHVPRRDLRPVVPEHDPRDGARRHAGSA